MDERGDGGVGATGRGEEVCSTGEESKASLFGSSGGREDGMDLSAAAAEKVKRLGALGCRGQRSGGRSVLLLRKLEFQVWVQNQLGGLSSF